LDIDIVSIRAGNAGTEILITRWGLHTENGQNKKSIQHPSFRHRNHSVEKPLLK
jgi:hypothetical protein